MNVLNYIIWSPEPEILPFIDWIPVRWYGLLFALGFIVGQQIIFHIFNKEGKPERDVETLTIVIIVATILGARLGHVFFYEPMKYLQDPISILKTWEGGLASHGAAVGIIIGVYIYCNYFISLSLFKKPIWRKQRRPGQSFLYVFDRLVIVVALGGAFIRFGNFLNSEIIGKPTNTDSGVVFAYDGVSAIESIQSVDEVSVKKVDGEALLENNKVYQPASIVVTFTKNINEENYVKPIIQNDINPILMNNRYVADHFHHKGAEPVITKKMGQYTATIPTYVIPRYPAQLYESISSLLLFVVLFLIWNYKKDKTPEGLIFGIFLIVLFSLRFAYEFVKEAQVAFEKDMTLNMGQWLSIPFLLLGLFLLIRLLFIPKDQQ